VAGYKVHIGTASHTYGAPVDVGTNTSYTFKNLTPRTTYHFAVKSYNVAGTESAFSAEVTKTIPPGRRSSFGDFDGDGRIDFTVWRPWNGGDWYIINSQTGLQTQTHWGGWGDIPVPGDYNGDGKTDIAAWRPETGDWWVLYDPTTDTYPPDSYLKQNWGSGALGDIPVPGDYDGDGKTDLAVWRKGDGTWRISYSGGGVLVQQWGVAKDYPVPGDYDGDGKTDLAVWRPWNGGDWYIINSQTGLQTQIHWGGWGDIPVPGDYNGDGKTDIAAWRPGTGDWWVLYDPTTDTYPPGSYLKQNWGSGALGDIPVPGDYDGDGKTDLAVWRKGDGTWRIPSSGGGVLVQPWGMLMDFKLGTYLNGAIP